jgi:hypothetical protein
MTVPIALMRKFPNFELILSSGQFSNRSGFETASAMRLGTCGLCLV